VIQLDSTPEEIGANVPAAVGLVGDGKAVVGQINEALEANPWQYPEETSWRTALDSQAEANMAMSAEMMADDSTPMNYYRVLREVRDAMPERAIIVGEGANTMDIGRTILNNYEARTRLDAGTYGTMGIGLGFAVAAAVVHPDRRTVAVQGDAAFGFSGMEVETACRYKLPIVFVIVNNNSIGGGIKALPEDPWAAPPSGYTIEAGYEKMIEGFGGKGYVVRTPAEFSTALKTALSDDMPSIVNVLIDPGARGKPQKFAWLTR